MDAALQPSQLELRPELLAAIKGIELRAKHMVEEQLIGNYRSHFKGTGVSFADLRQYNPGDEVRHIHWKASARSNKTYVKTYQEERQLSVLLLVDMSESMLGSGAVNLLQRAVEASALLAFLARAHGDLLGLCQFADEVQSFVPCSNKRNHFYRVLHHLLEKTPQKETSTNLAGALALTRHRLRHRTLIFIVSDFLCPDFTTELKHLASGHDCVCSYLPHSIPNQSCGLVRMRDAETGEEFLLDTNSKRARKLVLEQIADHGERVRDICRQSGADYFEVGPDVAKSLRNFMRRRK